MTNKRSLEEQLYDLTVQELISQLNRGETEDGDPIPAATLSVIVKFLKDQGVTGTPPGDGQSESPLTGLVNAAEAAIPNFRH